VSHQLYELLMNFFCFSLADSATHVTSHDLQHLLLLETNLFLGGLALHDRHRDMRLDIDNMSYEVCNSTSYYRRVINRRDLCQWYINLICILCS